MLVEFGFVRAVAGDGSEYTFRPSFGRIAALGNPREIVELFTGLHGPNAAKDAAYVLACLCDQEDPIPLIGGREISLGESFQPVREIVGVMPVAEQIIVARHLMRHGIIGKASPDKKGDGKFAETFEAADYVSAARVHLGLSSADAEALSMTEFHTMLEMKFPKAQGGARDVGTAEEYEATMKAFKESRRG